jgi:hypothetical protein
MPGAGAGPWDSPPRGRDFAEFVRRALHAAADQVEPDADGLVPIRTRILAEADPRDRQPARHRGRRHERRGVPLSGPGPGRGVRRSGS